MLSAEGSNAPAAVTPLCEHLAPEGFVVPVIPCPCSSAHTLALIGHHSTPAYREAVTFSSAPTTRQPGSADGYHVHDIDGKLFAIPSDAQAVLDSETLKAIEHAKADPRARRA
ncbi:hypothetical protein [Cupriavidus sp. D39]|uniref:hypothetical protein n=1 Tax=Cupriavidus sp. D39 TaxID=2997877 RepID=UPI00226E4C95|nr:hypothetical protein [Cupriavidus sp. D39]MCY0853829.1 hypothetical protein [Cupriavidus sp. D39]